LIHLLIPSSKSVHAKNLSRSEHLVQIFFYYQIVFIGKHGVGETQLREKKIGWTEKSGSKLSFSLVAEKHAIIN